MWWIHYTITGTLCGESSATFLALCVVKPLQYYWPSGWWTHYTITGPLCGESTATTIMAHCVVNPLHHYWHSVWWINCNVAGLLCGESTATTLLAHCVVNPTRTLMALFVVNALQHHWPTVCWIHYTITGPLCGESTATLLDLCVVNPSQWHYWPYVVRVKLFQQHCWLSVWWIPCKNITGHLRDEFAVTTQLVHTGIGPSCGEATSSLGWGLLSKIHVKFHVS